MVALANSVRTNILLIGLTIDHYKGLEKHNFRLERNAYKLCYIDEAISNHSDSDEVYNQAANSAHKEFVEWAQFLKKKALPRPYRK